MKSYFKILKALEKFYKKHEYYPSIRELAKTVKYHPNTVHYHIRQLEMEKYIKRNKQGRIISFKSLPTNSHAKNN